MTLDQYILNLCNIFELRIVRNWLSDQIEEWRKVCQKLARSNLFPRKLSMKSMHNLALLAQRVQNVKNLPGEKTKTNFMKCDAPIQIKKAKPTNYTKSNSRSQTNILNNEKICNFLVPKRKKCRFSI